MKSEFVILIASYNNEGWLEYNLASVLNQTYTNYKVIYVDDCSVDNTYEKAKSIIDQNPKFTLIRNEVNMGGSYNYTRFYDSIEDEQICVFLDGDDWLFDDHVLEKLNDFYNSNDCWMTYGQFYAYDGQQAVLANPQNTPYPDFVHEHKLYRLDHWRASHLRTYKGKLLKAVDKKDFVSLYDNKLFWHAGDLALAYPCLEMCPKNKIGVVDFPTYVYNTSQENRIRTQTRESKDNQIYEHEIRNKKKYAEGLSGRTLPQVNVIGYFQETNYIPKTFSFAYDLNKGDYDVTLINDMSLLPYLLEQKEWPTGKIIADLHETRAYNEAQNQVYDLVYDNYKKFDLIITHDERLLQLPNAKLRLCLWRCLNKNIHTKEWPNLADNSLYEVYDKTRNISCISSNKAFLPGHRKRLEFVNHIINKYPSLIDIFGIGFNPVIGKIEGLRDYRFSVAIENTWANNECSEKLSDCFLTGTIPVYYGCPNLGSYFDERGVLSFTTESELDSILHEIIHNGEQLYKDRFPHVMNNFKLVQNYSLNADQWFDRYVRDLIK
jgi:glycosyltransferase involved in cell wall biosynthesis